jgi:hypothetical protein
MAQGQKPNIYGNLLPVTATMSARFRHSSRVETGSPQEDLAKPDSGPDSPDSLDSETGFRPDSHLDAAKAGL